ncbi:GNAT family N-acetyltransferase [Pelagibacterium halotolerans]|uniref:GNAT family N-acetyltransferase n=1 Tax=Pelagibacterium halotolerans TaxID=531813 RepID=UPI00384C50C6
MEALRIKAIDAESWDDFERLFQSRGGPKYCWCMAWRASAEEVKAGGGVVRRSMIKARVKNGIPIGIVGLLEGEPVAWCSIAPRETFRGLGGPEDDPPDTAIWSITCFFIMRAYRGKGYSRQLLDAAIAYARENGAAVVEAYPVDPESPSYRHMGFLGLFNSAGFKELGRVGKRRHVMRLAL